VSGAPRSGRVLPPVVLAESSGRVVVPQDVGRLWSDRAAMVSSQAKAAGRDRSGTAGPLVARSPRVRPLASWWQQVPRHGPDCRPRMGCAGTIPTPPAAMASGITVRNSADRPSQLAPERPSQDCHPGSLAFGSNERLVTRPVARNQRAVCPHGQGFVSRRDERVGIGRQNHAHRRRAQKKIGLNIKGDFSLHTTEDRFQ